MNQKVTRTLNKIEENAQENNNKMRVYVFKAQDQSWIATITDHLLEVIHFPLVKAAAPLAPKSNSSNPWTSIEYMVGYFNFYPVKKVFFVSLSHLLHNHFPIWDHISQHPLEE